MGFLPGSVGPERPNVAFGAFNAPKAALGASNRTRHRQVTDA
jgi:hypothetical protein